MDKEIQHNKQPLDLSSKKNPNTSANKRLFGQYFTITNPFDTVAFYKWLEEMPENIKTSTILEPFAGANNIPAMLNSSEILTNDWSCFDIAPSEINHCKQFSIKKQDTLLNFPRGYDLCITNPPYLSKNSATRRKLDYPETIYDDLYKLCLEKMLQNVSYVAAIIPETFITSGLFHDRLKYVVSLTCKMFEDTECPVCLAMFNPETSTDFTIYQMNEKLGKYNDLCKGKIEPTYKHCWEINNPNGTIGIICIDNAKHPSIMFCPGENISSTKIKVSSRSFTRVSGLPDNIDLTSFIFKCNEQLNQYRNETKDVFLASFKGLRADGKYRRRLDFYTAKQIMSQVLWSMQNEKD